MTPSDFVRGSAGKTRRNLPLLGDRNLVPGERHTNLVGGLRGALSSIRGANSLKPAWAACGKGKTIGPEGGERVAGGMKRKGRSKNREKNEEKACDGEVEGGRLKKTCVNSE